MAEFIIQSRSLLDIPPPNEGGRPEISPDIVDIAARERMAGKFKSDYAAAKFYLSEYCPKWAELSIKQYENKLKFFAKKIGKKRKESTY